MAAALWLAAPPWPGPRGAARPPPHVEGPARLLFGLPLDPNRARPETLEVLPGIGPARAAAIVRAREERPFLATADLLRAHGIGPATLARVAPFLAITRASLRHPRAQPKRATLPPPRAFRGGEASDDHLDRTGALLRRGESLEP